MKGAADALATLILFILAMAVISAAASSIPPIVGQICGTIFLAVFFIGLLYLKLSSVIKKFKKEWKKKHPAPKIVFIKL